MKDSQMQWDTTGKKKYDLYEVSNCNINNILNVSTSRLYFHSTKYSSFNYM